MREGPSRGTGKLRKGSLPALFPDHEDKLGPLLAHHGLHPAVQGVAHVVQGHQLRDGAGVAQPGHLGRYGHYKILKTIFQFPIVICQFELKFNLMLIKLD